MPSATGWSANSSGSDARGAGADKALDDPVRMRKAGRELLSLAFFDARNHLLHLLGQDESAAALRLAARAGAYQEHWVSRHVQRGRGEACDAHGVRLAGIEPRVEAWLSPQGPPPGPADLRCYLADSLEITLELLATLNDRTEDDVSLHHFRCSLLHEDRLCETLATRLGHGTPPTRADRQALWQPAQRWLLGSPPGGLVPHHERWAHEVAVPEFEIDAQPVNWARYVEFAEDDGYDRPELWGEEGWQWLQRSGRRAPGQVEQLLGGVLLSRGPAAPGKLRRASPTQAALHLSRHEAQAWCAWAGRRLPTEPEWEIAAHQGASRGFVWGDVFEWVAGTARAYPGAATPAPGALDTLPAGAHGLGVLRGASFATRARLRHPKARRFAAPERDDFYAGFRSCAL